ncbi:MAG: glycerophosphodiester phosphodiesterase [Ruminococcaceae bacterium]|nr:glycerophosphodiester phosphodiesterase [Oscillospiraceae bacterium]
MNKKMQCNTADLADGFTYTAHSGCMGTPDNSLESITVGAQQGAQIVEIDLRFAPDGTPVLSHDKPKGNEVSLEQAFATVAKYDALRVNVDVKECTEQLAQVYEIAKKHGIEDRIFFTGLFEEDIQTAKKSCPTVPYWLNMDVRPALLQTEKYLQSLVEKVKNCGALGINMNKNNATEKLVAVFRQNNLGISLWTCNTTDEIRFALSLCPDNITTRRPDLLKSVLK